MPTNLQQMIKQQLGNTVPEQYKDSLINSAKLAGISPFEMAALYVHDHGSWPDGTVTAGNASVGPQGVQAPGVSVGPQGIQAPGVTVNAQGVTAPGVQVGPQGVQAGSTQVAPGQAPQLPISPYLQTGQNLFQQTARRPYNPNNVHDNLLLKALTLNHIARTTPARTNNDMFTRYRYGDVPQSPLNDFTNHIQTQASAYANGMPF